VLGGGGSSPHLHMLVDLLGLVMWPSDGVSWRLWVVGAIDNGGNGDVAEVFIVPHRFLQDS